MNSFNPAEWDAQVKKLDGSFLQSSAWGEFQAAAGAPVHYLTGKDWTCLLVEQQSRLRRYLFAPYGPTVAAPTALPEALETIAAFGRQHRFHWVRLEPCGGLSSDSDFTAQLSQASVKTVRSHKQINPLYTRIIDITADEQTLLTSISSSARRLIRRHLEQPVLTFRTSTDPKDITLFLDMLHTVSHRNQVSFHTDEHFMKEAATLMPQGSMRLELALIDGKPIASIVMHDFNKVTNYTYAASLPEARKLEASALLLWQAIVNAKAAGMTRLDLFGVAPDDAPSSHPWAGFSSFKRKFGGTVVRRGQTIDIPLSPRYYAYRTALKVAR